MKEYITNKWHPLKRYEGRYEINKDGEVKSIDRYAKAGKHESRIYRGKLKKAVCSNQLGYARHQLWKNNKVECVYVHRLVAENFIPNPSDYPIVMHLDDDPTNNYIDNLQWGTLKMNTQDMISKNRNKNQY